MDKSEGKEAKGQNYAQKAHFPSNHPNWRNIKQNFADSLAKGEDILQNLLKSFGLLQLSVLFNEILQN
jgi:hypothetical protein